MPRLVFRLAMDAEWTANAVLVRAWLTYVHSLDGCLIPIALKGASRSLAYFSTPFTIGRLASQGEPEHLTQLSLRGSFNSFEIRTNWSFGRARPSRSNSSFRPIIVSSFYS